MKKYLCLLLLVSSVVPQVTAQIKQGIKESNTISLWPNSKTSNHFNDPKDNVNEFSYMSFGYQTMQENYDEFTTELGADNVELLNRVRNLYTIEFGSAIDRYFISYKIGFNYKSNKDLDSVLLKNNNVLVGLNFGYDLVNSTRFSVVPSLVVNYQNVGLRNANKQEEIPLSSYMAEKDVHLNFNQFYGMMKFNLYYKFRNNDRIKEFFTAGVEAGYIVKLNNKSMIRANDNKLQTSARTSIDNLYIGFSISYWTALEVD